MDKRTVFLDGLVGPRAIKVVAGGVLVGEPPHLWLAHDTNGDLKADSKELVCDCFGHEWATIEYNANSLVWALDNRIYTAQNSSDLVFTNGAFRAQPALVRGQWGASQDDAGRIYSNSNSSALHVDILPARYFLRNPNLLRTRGSYEAVGESDAINATFPVRPTPGVNRGYQDGQLRADGTLAAYTAANSPLVYRGDQLPGDLYGNVFVAEPAGNLVSRLIVSDGDNMLRAQKAYQNAEFMASTDERFRPVWLTNAPDGTLYIVDMYRGIIQDRAALTEYLRDYATKRKLDSPVHIGRIWRVVHDSTRRKQPLPTVDSPTQLVDLLSHPNGWWRDTAQQLLVERGDRSVVPQLTTLAERAADYRTRLHALWTLDGLGSLEQSTVIRALDDQSRDVRVSALALSERWLTQVDSQVRTAVLKKLADKDWNVRVQVAATLGALPEADRELAFVNLLERSTNEPLTVDAVLSGARGSEVALLQRFLRATEESPSRDATIAILSATAANSHEPSSVQALINLLTDSGRQMSQRLAIARGLDAGLAGTDPGARARGAGGAGRGNGASTALSTQGQGAPAFPGARAGAEAAVAAVRSGGAGRGPVVSLALRTEPAALVSIANADRTELGQRASAILARLAWPGKPGVSGNSDMTPAEHERFDAGGLVYRNVCQPCHQENGRGADRIAANLVGSVLATGPAEIPARILFNGKEGPIGLMPPLGQALNDDQVAAVLTFIRHQWGNSASAVDATTIPAIRARSAARTKPWTNDELLRVAASIR
jgi:mono/diheme cytochrome c family protein/HEAT repeat protein